MRRKMEWFTNLLMVLSTTTIVLAGESSTEIMAVYIFLLACLTQAAIAAESRYVSPFFIQWCTRKYVRCFICPSCVYCYTSSLIIWKSMVVRGYTHQIGRTLPVDRHGRIVVCCHGDGILALRNSQSDQ